MYETMRDQKTVTIADDTVIQKLRKMGFPRQGRPLDNVVSEMLEDVCTNQALLQHPRFFAFVPSPASPLSWVGDVLTDAYNPHGGTWMESSADSRLSKGLSNGWQVVPKQWVESMLRNQPKWEVELAIVNFRYAPQGLSPQQQDKRSMVISQRMVEAGFACVLTAQLKGRTVLLICSIHPAATEEEIRYTIQLLDKYAVR